MRSDVILRAVTPKDEAFLLRLYGTTRPEVAMFGWDEAEQQAFIRVQFDMQTRSNAMHHRNAENSILVYHGLDAGRLIVDRTAGVISLTDIAVMPEFRRKGIATIAVKRLLEEADRTRRKIVLSVERMNAPAFNLYRKLGFEVTGETQVHLTMEWTPTKKKPLR